VVDAEAQEPAAAEQELAHLSVDDLIARLPYIPALGRDGTAAWLRESGRASCREPRHPVSPALLVPAGTRPSARARSSGTWSFWQRDRGQLGLRWYTG